jgi:hypothetical protein
MSIMKIGNHPPKLAALALLLFSSLFTPQTHIHATPVEADINNVAELIGQEVVFTGLVENVHQIASGTTFMDFGGRHPNAAFTCVAMASNVNQVGDLFQYNGKTIQVRGIVGEFNGKPQIVLDSANQITLLPENTTEENPTSAP